MDPMNQPSTPGSAPAQAQQPQQKKKTWLIPLTSILVLVALVVAGLMWWSSTSNKNAEETPAATVTITDAGFSPATIKIKKGQGVTWTSQSHISQKLVGTHNQPQGLATSEPLNFGDSYSFTFQDAGTYTYYDPAKVEHTGTVIVE